MDGSGLFFWGSDENWGYANKHKHGISHSTQAYITNKKRSLFIFVDDGGGGGEKEKEEDLIYSPQRAS